MLKVRLSLTRACWKLRGVSIQMRLKAVCKKVLDKIRKKLQELPVLKIWLDQPLQGIDFMQYNNIN